MLTGGRKQLLNWHGKKLSVVCCTVLIICILPTQWNIDVVLRTDQSAPLMLIQRNLAILKFAISRYIHQLFFLSTMDCYVIAYNRCLYTHSLTYK